MSDLIDSLLSVYEVPIFQMDNTSSANQDFTQSFSSELNNDNNLYNNETNISYISISDYSRLKNAAKRIGLDIYVVGSRANGKATITSDWDYVIPGLNCKKWKKIKNSIPGAKSSDKSKNYDLIHSPLMENYPYIKISAEDEESDSTH